MYDKFEKNVGNQNLGLLMHLVSYFTTILYIIYEYIQQISGSYTCIVKLKRYGQSITTSNFMNTMLSQKNLQHVLCIFCAYLNNLM